MVDSHNHGNNMLPNDKTSSPNRDLVHAHQRPRFNRNLYRSTCVDPRQTISNMGVHSLYKWIWMGNAIFILPIFPIRSMDHD